MRISTFPSTLSFFNQMAFLFTDILDVEAAAPDQKLYGSAVSNSAKTKNANHSFNQYDEFRKCSAADMILILPREVE